MQANDGGYVLYHGRGGLDWPNRLKLHTKSNDVFYCPSHSWVRNRGWVAGMGNTSYQLNVIRISYWQDSIGHAPKQEGETDQLLSPGVTWLNQCPDES